MYIMSKEGCKNIDKQTINEIGVPSIVLMEIAGERISKEILKLDDFLIICGIGNNGGDGLVIARKLKALEKNVKVIVVGDIEKGTEDFKINFEILKKLNLDILNLNNHNFNKKIKENILRIKIDSSNCLIDALFGVGLNRNIEGIYARIIEIINDSKIFTISIDTPSGIDANTGEVLNLAVKADVTFTIEVMKKGFFNTKAIEYLGEVNLISIDILEEVKRKNSEDMYILSEEFYKSLVPKRNKTGNKGSYGKVLVMAGSSEYTGAAYITTEATIRTGSGLVTLLIHKDSEEVLKAKSIESMVFGYLSVEDVVNLEKYDVIALGPGIGKSKLSADVLEFIIKNSKCNLVLDADALNIISERKDLIDFIKGRSIITPHPGEMSRLLGKSISYIESNRIDVTREFAKENEVVVLLKGHNTVISDGKCTYVNKTGCSKMASGGMGDCLTGIITSLVSQNLSNLEATLLGAYVHGYIGDSLGESRYIVNARDIILELPKTLEKLCEK